MAVTVIYDNRFSFLTNITAGKLKQEDAHLCLNCTGRVR